MASYIQNVTDSGIETPFYQPDYTFLQQQQGKANQQYEAGLQQVKSDYSSIVNQQVSDGANIQKKGEYLKKAQESLKRIAPMDLSLPQNVSQAESAFAPFWEDTMLLQDAYWTRKAQNQIQKGYAARDSKDEDIRKTFDPRSVELIQYQVNRLRNANRNPDEYKDIEIDDWMPFTNITNVLSDHKVADKMEVVMDIPTDDGRIVKVTNGPGSISNYKTYADGILGTQFNEQYNRLGKLSKEREISQFLQVNPGATRQDAIKAIATPIYESAKQQYAGRLQDFNHTISTKKAELEAVNKQVTRQGGKADPTQLASIQKLNIEIGAYSNRYSQMQKDYKDFETDGLNIASMHPESVIAQQYRNQDIDKWSMSMAADESREVRKDDAFWDKQQLQYHYTVLGETNRHNRVEEQLGAGRLGIESQKLQLDAQKLQLEHPELFGTITGGARYTGNATNQEFAMDPVQAANAQKQAIHDEIYSTIYNPSGVAQVLNTIPTNLVSSQETLAYTDFMNRWFQGGIKVEKGTDGINRWIGMSPEEKVAYEKTTKFLANETGMRISNPQEANKALLLYTKKQIDKQTANGAADSKQIAGLNNMYTGVKDRITIIDKDDAERAAALQNTIRSNPKEYNKVINNGKIADEQDILPYVSGLQLKDKNGRILDPKVLAAAYVQGLVKEVSSSGQPTFNINGEQYTTPYQFDQFSPEPSQVAYTNLTERFGRSDEFAAKKNKLLTSIVPSTSLYNDKNNIMGPRFAYDTKDKNSINQKRLLELTSPGNYDAMYSYSVGTGTPQPIIDAGGQQAVMDLLNDPNLQDYVGITHNYYPKSFNGKPMAEIIVGEIPSEGAGSKSIPANIKALSGKHILIEKSPSAKGTYINQFPTSADFSLHPLNRGETIASDPLQNSLGQGSYTITPWPKQNPTQYVIHFKKNLMSTKTGLPTTVETDLSLPAGEHNPYEIVSKANSILLTNGTNYYKNIDQYRTTVK